VHFALKMLWLKAQQLATILKFKMATESQNEEATKMASIKIKAT